MTNREDVLRRLKENSDDLFILSQLPHLMKIVAKLILDDHLVMIAPSKYLLSRHANIEFDMIANESFIVREVGSVTRMAMEKIFSKNKVMPKISLELGSGEAVKQAVMAAMGISLVSQSTIKQELKLKNSLR